MKVPLFLRRSVVRGMCWISSLSAAAHRFFAGRAGDARDTGDTDCVVRDLPCLQAAHTLLVRFLGWGAVGCSTTQGASRLALVLSFLAEEEKGSSIDCGAAPWLCCAEVGAACAALPCACAPRSAVYSLHPSSRVALCFYPRPPCIPVGTDLPYSRPPEGEGTDSSRSADLLLCWASVCEM